MRIPKPVVLCILDGWGLSDTLEANAPALAQTPVFDRLIATCPHSTLITHGPDVGLPSGQMGNSEVGHTNIGAGSRSRMAASPRPRGSRISFWPCGRPAARRI